MRSLLGDAACAEILCYGYSISKTGCTGVDTLAGANARRSAAAEIIVAGSTMDGNSTLKAGERVRLLYALPYETTF
jgi:hypothetical protein